jgi:hypothetical protein
VQEDPEPVADSNHQMLYQRRLVLLAVPFGIDRGRNSRCFRRLSRWISHGAAAAASQPSIGTLSKPKARRGRGSTGNHKVNDWD